MKQNRKERLLSALKEARERIQDEERWVHSAFAVSSEDKDVIVSVTSSLAGAWCAVGTLAKSLGLPIMYETDMPSDDDEEDDLEQEERDFIYLMNLLDEEAYDEYGDNLMYINDNFPKIVGEETPFAAHASVLDVYDHSYKALEALPVEE